MPSTHKDFVNQASTTSSLRSPHRKPQSRRGIALISVLAMVMLLTVLTVAFMMRAGTERQNSGFYRSEATTRELSDTTLNLIEGLINEGTNQVSTVGGNYYAWASQPGALRVFDNTGAPYKAFKLYSAQSMTWSAASTATTIPGFMSADAPPATWYTTPGSWVDLNAPVNTDPNPQPITVSGKQVYLGQPTYTHFPILDPRDPTASAASSTYDSVTTKMDGFSITAAPVDTTATTDGNMIDSTQVPNPAPMPVRWLYVLQNGTLVTPDITSPDVNGNYTFVTAAAQSAAPTAVNPIVGRIAFWTDDETCKVNVNTAGADGLMTKTSGSNGLGSRTDDSAIAYGSYWSPPYFGSIDDWGETTNASAPGSGPFLAGFATAMPVYAEYQRYPGHPATVALTNILAGLGMSNLALNRVQSSDPLANISDLQTQNSTPLYSDITATLPGITPRYTFGGSKENVVPTFNSSTYTATMQVVPPPTSAFRLYPTLSEVMFSPMLTATGGGRGQSPVNTADTVSRQRMESGRFFLTTHSRAPELNLFGLPRVGMWPLSSTTSQRTAIDNLIAFCTTIGGANSSEIYSFVRTNYTSALVGGSRDSTVDIGISRNLKLMSYLDYLTRKSIPGFGGDFYDKAYGITSNSLVHQNDQILTEIFDYIRTVDIEDSGALANSQTSYGYPDGTGWVSGRGFGAGQVVPSLALASNMGSNVAGTWVSNTQGNGSFPRLVEATLQFVALGKGGTPMAGVTPAVNAIPISPSVVNFCFPKPYLPTTTASNYPYPNNATSPSVVSGKTYGPPPSTTVGNANYNVTAYNAYVAQNPCGYMLGYPITPQIAQGDAPKSATLTYAYNPLVGTSTTPTPTSGAPYAPPGALDPGTSSYPSNSPINTAPPKAGPYITIYRVHNYFSNTDSAIPPDGTTAVQCFFLMTFINPAQDWMYTSPYVYVTVSGLNNLAIADTPTSTHLPLGFSPSAAMEFGSGQDWDGGGRSGYYGILGDFGQPTYSRQIARDNVNTPGIALPNGFPYASSIIPITTASRMGFIGGTINVRLYDSPISNASGSNIYTDPITGTPSIGTSDPSGPDTASEAGGHWLQTYTITFPTPANGLVMPTIPANPSGTPPSPPTASYTAPYPAYITPWVAYAAGANSSTYNTGGYFEQTGPIVGLADPPGCVGGPYNRWWQSAFTVGFAVAPYNSALGQYIGTGDVVQSMVLSKAWSDPRILLSRIVPAVAWTTHPNFGLRPFAHNMYIGTNEPMVGNGKSPYAGSTTWTTAATLSYVGSLAGNFVESSVTGATSDTIVTNPPWAPCNFGTTTSPSNMAPTTSSGLYPPAGFPPDWDMGIGSASDGPWINKADEGSTADPGDGGFHVPYQANPSRQVPAQFTPNRELSGPGMLGSLPTGVPQIDSLGNVSSPPASWQTLLFRPGPGVAATLNGIGGVQTHPGEGILSTATTPGVSGAFYTTPPDHLWMDLFWMPVAEPYAISEPMSTAGKINMNYQIVPFTYIKRATALRAAMASEEVAQVAVNQSLWKGSGGYAQGIALNAPYNNSAGLSQQVNARFPIDLDVTQSQFDFKFSNWDVFRSASQICEVFLVPMDIPNTLLYGTAANVTAGTYSYNVTPDGNYTVPPVSTPTDLTGVKAFAKDWYAPVTSTTMNPPAAFALVGDNVREQPYAHLYPKLTTKSNTYTVYYRVQALKTAPTSDPTKWNEATGTVTGEYRGSTTIERFIDPNEGTTTGGVLTPSIPDAATQVSSVNPTSLEGFYKWRVVENHQFAP